MPGMGLTGVVRALLVGGLLLGCAATAQADRRLRLQTPPKRIDLEVSLAGVYGESLADGWTRGIGGELFVFGQFV
ncbi:MAG: hypothetical protein ACYTGX_12660, partial [Planctomycetota bacterium]